MQDKPAIQPLSVTHDTHGHTITRYPGDVLVIVDKSDREVGLAERADVETWYWNQVGVRGSDPAREK